MNIELLSEPVVVKHPGATRPWYKRWVPRRTQWRLVEPFRLRVNGIEYTVPVGFVFDGSSIPFFLWCLFPPTYHAAWVASVFHDYCYRKLYKKVTKAFADNVFYYIMLKEGANKVVAKAFYKAVSVFGRGGW